jgi:hypothetical protein
MIFELTFLVALVVPFFNKEANKTRERQDFCLKKRFIIQIKFKNRNDMLSITNVNM